MARVLDKRSGGDGCGLTCALTCPAALSRSLASQRVRQVGPQVTRSVSQSNESPIQAPYHRESRRAHGNEFTAVVERDGRWYIAYCPEIPGANGQGRTKAAALKSLAGAIALILDDRRKDDLRGVPAKATREKVVVG